MYTGSYKNKKGYHFPDPAAARCYHTVWDQKQQNKSLFVPLGEWRFRVFPVKRPNIR